MEEILRLAYSLATICKSKFQNALMLFDKGLMRIMIKVVKINNIEIKRQCLRCISSMCPVLATITPGRHPSIIVERLQNEVKSSEKQNEFTRENKKRTAM